MPSVPSSIGQITSEWLSGVLKAAGKLQSDITHVRLEPIGAGVGLMGELGRLHLTFSGDESLPETIVAKCAAQNENRQVARILDFYNREADFYNRVAGQCPLRIPDSYHADVNQESYDFVLLMEDLGDVSLRDQLIGASKDEAFSAIGNVAEMHARWWGANSKDHSWMYDMMSVVEAERVRDLLYMPALEPTLEKFSYLLNGEMKSVCQRVGENFSQVWAENMTDFDTFVHGDYRQDNMLYEQGSADALVMDWQISGRGKAVFDVAYFMCQSVASELRSEIEKELLAFYVGKLADAGIDYPFEVCWDDYRRIILGCLVYPMTVCGTLDTANERGKALGESMLSRNLAAIEDLGCAELI